MPEPTISDFYSQMVNDPFFTASEGQTKEETARILAHNRFRQQKNNEIALSFTKQIATDIANEIFKQMRPPNPGKQHLTWNPSTHRWVKRQTAAAGKAAVGETKPVKAHPKKAKGKPEPVTPPDANGLILPIAAAIPANIIPANTGIHVPVTNNPTPINIAPNKYNAPVIAFSVLAPPAVNSIKN